MQSLPFFSCRVEMIRALLWFCEVFLTVSGSVTFTNQHKLRSQGAGIGWCSDSQLNKNKVLIPWLTHGEWSLLVDTLLFPFPTPISPPWRWVATQGPWQHSSPPSPRESSPGVSHGDYDCHLKIVTALSPVFKGSLECKTIGAEH